LVVVSGSYGLGLLMEVPDLGSSTIWCLDDHVSVVDQIKISSASKFRNNVEISFNIKTNVFIHLTLGWLLVLIDIDDFPLLSEFVVLATYHDISVFHISVDSLVLNLDNLSSLVDEITSLISEELPPS